MKKNDILLIVLVAIISFAGLFLTEFYSHKGDTVIVNVNGKKYCEKSLNDDTQININNTNILVIKNGEVYMESATCKDKLCVHQGKIHDSSKKIICLPNKVTVEVTKKSDIDAVVR